jgi:hypothetical protein
VGLLQIQFPSWEGTGVGLLQIQFPSLEGPGVGFRFVNLMPFWSTALCRTIMAQIIVFA